MQWNNYFESKLNFDANLKFFGLILNKKNPYFKKESMIQHFNLNNFRESKMKILFLDFNFFQISKFLFSNTTKNHQVFVTSSNVFDVSLTN